MSTFGKVGARSMLEHRKFARDYVQDGLIAMWDGIENSGWGVHDTSTSTWKDLVGTMPYPISVGSCTWSENALVNSSGSNVTLANRNGEYNNGALLKWWQNVGIFGERVGNNCNLVGDYTIEVAANINSAASTVGLLFYAARQFFEFKQMTVVGLKKIVFIPADNWNNSGNIGYNLTGIPCSFSGVARVASGSSQYVNNVLFKTGTSVWPTNRPYDPRYNTQFILPASSSFYSYRFYNRALTADEVAYNYSIDKIRFNLP